METLTIEDKPDSNEVHHGHGQGKNRLLKLSLAALGVVFGDIGTSPLYALKEIFSVDHANSLPVSEANVLGSLSLITWAMILIVSLQYMIIMMYADNDKEGGIFALMTRVLKSRGGSRAQSSALVFIGIVGASLFMSDGMLTPAISVLSAMEGLKLLSHQLDDAVIPLAILVIVGLFSVQRFGTGKVGKFFGPLVMVWFLVLGALGIPYIARDPTIFRALSPSYAVEMFVRIPKEAFYSLGSVVLVMTGGEAAYADMGHFGPVPIRLAWFTVALPCLLLNYYGQAVLILENPAFVDPPFFLMAPAGCTLPLVLLATMATCIASQALISGVFSLTRQAILLGYLPRLQILHTSKKDIGQIYIPVVNWILFVCVVAIVLAFQSSSNLAAAYGLAICGIMVLTTILAFFAFALPDNRPLRYLVRATLFMLLCVCTLFLAANSVKIPSGGWVPVVLSIILSCLIMSWRRGKQALQVYLERVLQPLGDLIEDLEENPLPRVPGVGVYLTARQDVVPLAMRQNLRHHQALHSTLILVTIQSADVPTVPAKVRNVVTHSAPNVWQIEATFGFMQEPDIPQLMRTVADQFDSIDFDDDDVSYFISREIVKFTFDEHKTHNLLPVEHVIFNWMHRNAQRSAEFFKIAPGNSIEVGTEIIL